MTIRFATPDEIADWNKYILANPDDGNFLQGFEFAEQKRIGGWTPRYIFADKLAIVALEKTVPGLGKLWYLPKGPGIATIRQLDNLLPELKTFAAQHRVFLVKVEPELLRTKETTVNLMKLGLVRAKSIQPDATVLVDISKDLDTVITSLNQKGRHAIKRAQRDGVTAKLVKATDKNCRIMFDLLALTAAGSFSIRSFDYYKNFWETYEKAGLGQLFFAYVDGNVVAGAYAIALGKKSSYKDGASVRDRPAYGASHLLQWRVIEWAKEKGATIHDLCGVPPSDHIHDTAHPYYGLGRFKTSFNKEVTDYVGVYDLPVKLGSYKLWTRIGERLVKRLHYALHHENYY